MMISQDPVTTGAAPQADLYASAYATTANDAASDATQLLTVQQIAEQAGMAAINNSWGQLVRDSVTYDGNSKLTLGMDWIASNYDVLIVKAGNEGKMVPLPADIFNGLVVGASSQVNTAEPRRIGRLPV